MLDPLAKLNASSHPLASQIVSAHQMQKIKILRIKYGWPEKTEMADNKFVYRMVKCNGPDLFQDLREFAEYNAQIKDHACLYAINTLASSGALAKAIKLYDDLDDEYVQKISGVLLRTTTALIEDAIADKDEFNHLMELIKHIISREHSAFGKKVYGNLLRVQLLRDVFGLNVTLDSLKEPAVVDRYMNEGIDHLIGKLKEKPANFVHNAMKFIQLLAKALNVEGVQVTLRFCRQMRHVHLACALAIMVVGLYSATVQNGNDFIDLAVLLLAQQATMIEDHKCDTLLSMAYPMAQQLLLMVQNVDKMVFYDDIRELLRWTRIGTHSYNMDRIEQYMGSSDELDADVSSGRSHISHSDSLSMLCCFVFLVLCRLSRLLWKTSVAMIQMWSSSGAIHYPFSSK